MDVLHAVQRGDDGRGGVVHIGGVDQGRPGVEQRQAAAAGTFQHPFHQLRVAGAPDDVRAHRRDPEFRHVRGQRQQFGLGLGAGVVAVRAGRVRRLGAQPGDGGPELATDGEETNTRSRTPASRAARSRRRVPSTLTRRNPPRGPVKETLAARWMTPSAPSTAATDGVVVRDGPGDIRGAVDASGTALERADGVALPHQQPGHYTRRAGRSRR